MYHMSVAVNVTARPKEHSSCLVFANWLTLLLLYTGIEYIFIFYNNTQLILISISSVGRQGAKRWKRREDVETFLSINPFKLLGHSSIGWVPSRGIGFIFYALCAWFRPIPYFMSAPSISKMTVTLFASTWSVILSACFLWLPRITQRIYLFTKAHLPGCFLYLVGKVKLSGNFLHEHWNLTSPRQIEEMCLQVENHPP